MAKNSRQRIHDESGQGFSDESNASVTISKPLQWLSYLLYFQGLGFFAAFLVGVWLIVDSDYHTDSLMYGIEVVALLVAIFFVWMGRAASRRRTWFRGPVITAELLITFSLFASGSAFSRGYPLIAAISAIAVLVLLFNKTVITETTSASRFAGAYPDQDNER